MNIRRKEFIIAIIIPLAVGILSTIISKDTMMIFNTLNKPPLSPPAWLFPIVWTILYILMGIASYLIYIDNNQNKNNALLLYALTLVFNFLWPILFFNLQLYFFSFLWIILLWILIVLTIKSYYFINPYASYLLILYLLWVTFAAYLNYAIAVLNK